MITHSQERNTAPNLKVVFADLNVGQPKAVDPILDSALMLWPRQVFDAAVDSSALHDQRATPAA